ncbi:MAG: hypothetical protein ACTSSG_04985 [Candidatus Heimdallarchaeaceae archaeon]
MKGFCGVYKSCDGEQNKIYQGNSYGKLIGFGGVGSSASFANSVLSLKKIN